MIDNGIIQTIGEVKDGLSAKAIDGTGKYLLPSIIDRQVHFREPGLAHKGGQYTASKPVVVSGDVTSFIDMLNTFPNVLMYLDYMKKLQVTNL